MRKFYEIPTPNTQISNWYHFKLVAVLVPTPRALILTVLPPGNSNLKLPILNLNTTKGASENRNRERFFGFFK